MCRVHLRHGVSFQRKLNAWKRRTVGFTWLIGRGRGCRRASGSRRQDCPCSPGARFYEILLGAKIPRAKTLSRGCASKTTVCCHAPGLVAAACHEPSYDISPNNSTGGSFESIQQLHYRVILLLVAVVQYNEDSCTVSTCKMEVIGSRRRSIFYGFNHRSTVDHVQCSPGSYLANLRKTNGL